MKTSTLVVAAVVTTTLISSIAQAQIRYVDDDAPLLGDGLSWNTAYPFLQDALFEASGNPAINEVRVAQGTYKPDQDEGGNVTPDDRTATFQLINGVALRGGFAGIGQLNPDARDIVLYTTILTGDLLGDDGPGFTNYTENSIHVVTVSGTDIPGSLDGFTIGGGNADGAPGQPTSVGGGVHIEYASPVISECTITANTAYRGGGLSVSFGSPTINGCVFTANLATATGGAALLITEQDPKFTDCVFTGNVSEVLWGGAVDVAFGSATLARCLFAQNSAAWGGAIRCADNMLLEACDFIGNNGLGGAGGAVAASGGTTVATGCTFISNFSVYHGGAVSCVSGQFIGIGTLFESNHAIGDGGAFSSGYVGRSTLLGCSFIGNSSEGERGGGAVHHASFHLTVMNCTFIENAAVTAHGGAVGFDVLSIGEEPAALLHDCLMTGNTAAGFGGAVYLQTKRAMAVTNCTIVGNSAGAEGGGAYFGQVFELASLNNSIIRGNGSGQIGGLTESPPFPVRYCNVEGGFPGLGNIDADPLFVDPLNGNYRLQTGSPAIDSGHNWAVPTDSTDLDGDGDTAELTPLDLDGNPRFADAVGTPDTGCGATAVVDMGAYEFPGNALNCLRSGDVNGDGAVNVLDLIELLVSFGASCGDVCCLADFNDDGSVNVLDLIQLLLVFGTACP